jgi:hypothetical protein
MSIYFCPSNWLQILGEEAYSGVRINVTKHLYNYNTVQVGLILCDFFLCNFALAHRPYSDHFSSLKDNFRFNAIWHTLSTAVLFCRRLAESDVTFMPSVMCTDYLDCDTITGADIAPFQRHWLLLQT